MQAKFLAAFVAVVFSVKLGFSSEQRVQRHVSEEKVQFHENWFSMKLGFSSERRVQRYVSEEKVQFHENWFSMKLGFSSERRVQRYASEEKSSISRKLVGSSGLEPPTSRLSGVRSNHLSYEPV